MEKWRRYLEADMLRLCPTARINGGQAARLPNTSNITLPGVDNAALAMKLDLEGVAIGTGSACTSASRTPSHVLTAMGLTPEQSRQSVRLSLSRFTTQADVDGALAAFRRYLPTITGAS